MVNISINFIKKKFIKNGDIVFYNIYYLLLLLLLIHYIMFCLYVYIFFIENIIEYHCFS